MNNNNNNNNNENFTITTEDGIKITLNKKISLFSELLKNLIENYDFNNNNEPIKKINSNDIKILNEFCEICDFEPIQFEKPFWKFSIDFHKKKLNKNNNNKLKNFYENLTSNKLKKYYKISDYYQVNSIEEIIYLKLYEVFLNENNIKKYFENEQKNFDEIFNINNEIKEKIEKNYMNIIENQLDSLNEEEINKLCNEYFN
jgi:hypothetical protein